MTTAPAAGRAIAIDVPASYLLPSSQWGDGPRASHVIIHLHPGADYERFLMAAAQLAGNLDGALLLKIQAEHAAKCDAPWVEPDLAMRERAWREANLLRAADADIASTKARTVKSTKTRRGTRDKAVHELAAPMFAAAYARLEREGRKRIGERLLSGIARQIAGKDYEHYALLTESYARLWLAARKQPQ